MIDPPEVVETSQRHTAVIRLTVPRDQIQEVMGPAIGEVLAALMTAGAAPTGPVFSHHLRMDPDVFDFEVGVPVAAPVSAVGRVVPGQLPATRAARTTYHGGYDGLAAAWGAFMTWVDEQSLTPADDLWECYVAGPESGDAPSGWRTELVRPLR